MQITNSVIVVGIPGSGKSTFCQQLASKNPDYTLIKEPLSKRILTALDFFYKNPQKYSLAMQLDFLEEWRREFKLKHRNALGKIIIDASPISTYYHSRTSREMGWMNKLDFDIFENRFRESFKDWFQLLPQEIIYNKVETNVALQRIKRRNRKFEQSISIDYLDKLKGYLEEYLETQERVIEHHNRDYIPNTKSCFFCEDRGFVVKPVTSKGKVAPNAVFNCLFCSYS